MKSSLHTLFKGKKLKGFSFDTQQLKSLVMSPYLLAIEVVLALVVCCFIYTVLQEKNEDLNLASKLISQLEIKAQKGRLNKQKEVEYFHKLGLVEDGANLESPKLESESYALKTFEIDQALKESMILINRLGSLKHNELSFKTIDEKDIRGFKESILKLENPLLMDEKDLKTMLKKVELNQLGGPQRIFKEFTLKLEKLSPQYQTYNVDFTLIERKKA